MSGALDSMVADDRECRARRRSAQLRAQAIRNQELAAGASVPLAGPSSLELVIATALAVEAGSDTEKMVQKFAQYTQKLICVRDFATEVVRKVEVRLGSNSPLVEIVESSVLTEAFRETRDSMPDVYDEVRQLHKRLFSMIEVESCPHQCGFEGTRAQLAGHSLSCPQKPEKAAVSPATAIAKRSRSFRDRFLGRKMALAELAEEHQVVGLVAMQVPRHSQRVAPGRGPIGSSGGDSAFTCTVIGSGGDVIDCSSSRSRLHQDQHDLCLRLQAATKVCLELAEELALKEKRSRQR